MICICNVVLLTKNVKTTLQEVLHGSRCVGLWILALKISCQDALSRTSMGNSRYGLDIKTSLKAGPFRSLHIAFTQVLTPGQFSQLRITDKKQV